LPSKFVLPTDSRNPPSGRNETPASATGFPSNVTFPCTVPIGGLSLVLQPDKNAIAARNAQYEKSLFGEPQQKGE
jgi:hypothetical protein